MSEDRVVSEDRVAQQPPSPTESKSQNRVDRLVTQVNEEIELGIFVPSPDMLKQMVEGFAGQQSATDSRLIETFSRLGESATPFLLDGLSQHPNPVVRCACGKSLGQIGDADAVSGLIRALLYDHDRATRGAAADALGRIGEPAAQTLVDMIVSAAEAEDEETRGRATWVLGHISGNITASLYGLVSHPSAAVRAAVMNAIAPLAQSQFNPRARIILTESLNDSASEVRTAAATTLGRLQHETAYQPLIACLRDTSAEVRKAAAIALGELNDPSAAESLEPLLQDADRSVQQVVEQVLSRLRFCSPEE